jgi:hypothetical protein
MSLLLALIHRDPAHGAGRGNGSGPQMLLEDISLERIVADSDSGRRRSESVYRRFGLAQKR